jgi:hypothetical protein
MTFSFLAGLFYNAFYIRYILTFYHFIIKVLNLKLKELN